MADETNAKGPGAGSSHLRFVWNPSGYVLVEREGEPPAPGAEVEENETRFLVVKVGPSPLPGDSRPCAYLDPAV
jgi:hypothetical protein